MLNLIETPAAEHIAVQKFQRKIHERLLKLWGLSTDDYQSYGLAYRNQTKDGYIAQWYLGEGNYSNDLYFDDKYKAVSFFGLSGGFTHDVGDTVKVHLVFFVDVQKIKPTVHRADAEIRQDVVGVCSNGLYGFNYEGMDLWLENVLREYNGSRRDERLKYIDMHPKHCFRLNFELRFNQTKIC
jgi:hypothetical protein